MSEPFIGQITTWGGDFAPRGWAFCDGALLPIAQNTALYSILRTNYGGDGRTTVGLPNFNGRAVMHPGNGPGLTARRLGETGGEPTVTLTTQQMAQHSHTLNASSAETDEEGTANPSNASLGTVDATAQLYGAPPPTAAMATEAATETGGGGAHDNQQPYLATTYIIALVGMYPPRS